jgi:hypothetical protein
MIRHSSSRQEVWNAVFRAIGSPSTTTGSGTPQWAVTGFPGQIGHTSPAALSQTVTTRSIRGDHNFFPMDAKAHLGNTLANEFDGFLRRRTPSV